MIDQLSALETRIDMLGNHFQKYLLIIKQRHAHLLQALKLNGRQSQVALWQFSGNPETDMQIISGLSQDEKTRLHFLSCYYASQFLFMNLRYLDILDYQIGGKEYPALVYHRFMMNIGADFRRLSTAYMRSLLKLYLPDEFNQRFFICSVGTRSDQDDIDVGIITWDNADVAVLNDAFRKITQNMLVYATPLHLYLSEEVGHEHYTTTIAEYQRLLDRRVQNVVIISELLNARLMLGSQALFEEFINRIMTRYYFKAGKDQRYHEGFLRGILGEARAILISPPRIDIIAPKSDGLRLLKSLLYAKKTIQGVPQVNAWDIMSALRLAEPNRGCDYDVLFECLSFTEILKFLLQLYVVQEEAFRPDELEPATLERIAKHMGYQNIRGITAWSQLALDYHKQIRVVRAQADRIIGDINPHLERISGINRRIRKMQKAEISVERGQVLFKQIISKAEFFNGLKYWEDILNVMEKNPAALKNIIKQVLALRPAKQDNLLGTIARMSAYTQLSVIRMLGLLGKLTTEESACGVFTRLNEAYLHFITGRPASLDRLCRIFSYFPQRIREYLETNSDAHLIIIRNWLDQPLRYEELRLYLNQIKTLLNLYLCSGKYFRRYVNVSLMHYPECLAHLDDPDRLLVISRGILALSDSSNEIVLRKKLLGEYYDLEFMRIGIHALKGLPLAQCNQQFSGLSDTFLSKLFLIILQELQEECADLPPELDGFALFTTGGHGRGQAFDDDYDLIALCATDDPKTIAFISRIVTHMNREIARRGLLPHYRLGEILGRFVCPVSQVRLYLNSGDRESFIDISQFLGTRMVIGSDLMKDQTENLIIRDCLRERKSQYISRMINEVRERNRTKYPADNEGIDIKEIRGGLRDIEAVALIVRAFLELTDFKEFYDFKLFAKRIPLLSERFDTLAHAYNFLRSFRNIYRLAVAAEDIIHTQRLAVLNEIFGNLKGNYALHSAQIEDELKAYLKSSHEACNSIINTIVALLGSGNNSD
jgi:hypothetical protein